MTALMKFSALGDIAMKLPFIRTVEQPACIITSPLGKAFLQDEFSDFIVLKDKSIGSHIRLIREIRKRRFSDFIDLQGNDRCRFISKCSAAKTIHNGYDVKSPYRPYSDLVRSIEARIDIRPQAGNKERTYIVFNTGSSAKWAAKRPPAEKWIEFAEIVNARFGLPIKMTGSAEEREYVDSIARQLPGTIEVVAGETSLSELKQLLSQAFLTVSTDSAALHISAVQGTPTIGIFGSTTWEGKLSHSWTAALYDQQYYPDGKMPVCTGEPGHYYDHIDLNDGLDALKEFLV